MEPSSLAVESWQTLTGDTNWTPSKFYMVIQSVPEMEGASGPLRLLIGNVLPSVLHYKKIHFCISRKRVFFSGDDDESGRQLSLHLAPPVQVRTGPAAVRVSQAVLRNVEDVFATAQRQPRSAPSCRGGSSRVGRRSALSGRLGHRQHPVGNKVRPVPRKVEPRAHQP